MIVSSFLLTFVLISNITCSLCFEETLSLSPNVAYSLTNESYPYYKRKSPPSQIDGTVVWERLESESTTKFSPRHSHATCIFQCPNSENNTKCIWLTGGRTELYRTFNLEYEDRTADIWWSEDGATWNKVMEITGDFIDLIGNFDAKYGGEVAPWFSRYGHSLNVVDTDGDGNDDVMVLMGGFNPIPSNDVWISRNGTAWFFDDYAPWSERGYHATIVFQSKLWVIGGSPLKNDVWSSRLIKDPTRKVGYRLEWTLEVPHGKAPWAPRCGMCVVSQHRMENVFSVEGEVDVVEKEYLYLIGGYAGWPRDDPRWDGDRTRNDVWITLDGREWTRVNPPVGKNTMPFVGRGWHACTVWHSPDDRSRGVRLLRINDTNRNAKSPPRIYISGGGYIGSKKNNVVTTLEGYLDLWWTVDGSHWTRVDYEEGTKESLYSTNEWTATLIGNKYVHLGKWGHSMISFPTKEDLDLDGEISDVAKVVEFCSGGSQSEAVQCAQMFTEEDKVPSLFIIGGDTTDGGPIVNDVFISRIGVHCEIQGETCSRRGSCGPSSTGCVCDSAEVTGEYCEVYNELPSSESFSYSKVLLKSLLVVNLSLILSIYL